MNSTRNTVGEFVEWREKTEEFGENRANDESGEKIPKEEIYDAEFGRTAAFPGNAGVSEKGDKSSNEIRNEAIEPQEVIIFQDDASDESVD